MATNRLASETPAVVAKRMSDLILCFPSAAAGGVQWQTLVSKYNERHSTSLDIEALGHSTAVVAATALLWDTVRLVDSKDQNNPLVAIEDGEAMTAQPQAAATWPSLYKALCEIVSEHGSTVEEVSGDEAASAILVSQLKPLLQRHWHDGFDEGSLSYFNDQGKFVRVKKMKHLLQALMQWREQRAACHRRTDLDEELKCKLEVVPSKKHNDLLLRCVMPSLCPSTASKVVPAEVIPVIAQQCPPKVNSTDCQSVTSESTATSTDLMDQIAILRAENDRLRSKNSILEQQTQNEVLQKEAMCLPVRACSPELSLPVRACSPGRKDVWDDPMEPPPFEYRGRSAATPSASTAVPSSFFNSGDVTPLTIASSSHAHTASATPSMTTWIWDGQNGQICSMVPMFYVMGDRGLHNIPSGVVQQTVSMWETKESNKVLPSYFSMGARES